MILACHGKLRIVITLIIGMLLIAYVAYEIGSTRASYQLQEQKDIAMRLAGWIRLNECVQTARFIRTGRNADAAKLVDSGIFVQMLLMTTTPFRDKIERMNPEYTKTTNSNLLEYIELYKPETFTGQHQRFVTERYTGSAIRVNRAKLSDSSEVRTMEETPVSESSPRKE